MVLNRLILTGRILLAIPMLVVAGYLYQHGAENDAEWAWAWILFFGIITANYEYAPSLALALLCTVLSLWTAFTLSVTYHIYMFQWIFELISAVLFVAMYYVTFSNSFDRVFRRLR